MQSNPFPLTADENTQPVPPSSPLLLVGPTGSGKTAVAVALSRLMPLEVLSADSRQIYRGLDIGTAKPTPEEQAAVPHHGLDLVDPDETFDAARFQEYGRRVISEVQARGKVCAVVGGTGFYFRALTEGLFEGPGAHPTVRDALQYRLRTEGNASLHRFLQVLDPRAATVIHPNDPVRLIRALEVYEATGRPLSAWWDQAPAAQPLDGLWLGLEMDRQVLYHRIDERVRRMWDQGLLEETRAALDAGYAPDCPGLSGIGYAQAIQYLTGEASRDEAIEAHCRATRQYAKRQLTWFRKNPRLHWLDANPPRTPESLAKEIYDRFRQVHSHP